MIFSEDRKPLFGIMLPKVPAAIWRAARPSLE
jgi:hypothetical protein